MKSQRTILTLLLTIMLLSFAIEKDYAFKMKEGEVIMLYNTLQFSKQAIQTSEAPANQVLRTIQNIDSLTNIIAREYNAQKESTKK